MAEEEATTIGRGTKGPTKCREEGPVWAQVSSLKAWEDPAHPCPSFPSPLEPGSLLPSSCLSRSPPPPLAPIKTTFLHGHYSSFLFFFVRNSHKKQCKTISVGVLFYITKTPRYII